MGFLSKILAFITGSPASATAEDPNGLWVHFRCNRCHEPVAVRIDRRNDLSATADGPGALFVRKQVMDNKCFQLMEAELWFDRNYNIVQADISGGEMLTPDEYEALTTPQDQADTASS